jgi:hypothetical protein
VATFDQESEEDRPVEPRFDFAVDLFRSYPKFRPTRALCLDFEGDGSHERILGLFWPQRAGPDRFALLWRWLGD